ncbi:MAG: trypsin-like peptidase domain-containing protein [Planctomycetota bacterium]
MKANCWQAAVLSACGAWSAFASWSAFAALSAFAAFTCPTAIAAAEPLGLEEETAFRKAVDRVAAAVVRIEPAGLSESGIGGAAEAAPATGPSSGLVVDAAGWVVATAFAVPTDATQAIVVLADGTRQAARVVGRDLSRGLVLLKIELAPGIALPVATTAPRSELAVGQWTLAIGRAWSTATPSVAIGILSATNRAWGKAVQTDAAVSPANYGGPLVDIEGRVIGILAPLPADTAGMMAGTELYDSGIGFAVPIADIVSVLPRLQTGETLRPGILGIGYSSRDPFTAPANIATCRAGSPAAKAGLRSGDTIVSAAGQPVTRIAELRHVLAPRYAGDTVDLVVERPKKAGGTTQVSARATLVAALPPWRRPVLGIVPDRSAGTDKPIAKEADAKEPNAKEEDDVRGVRVQWLWPEGPAARAGVRAGDIIESIVEIAAADEPAAAEQAGEPLIVTAPAMLAGFVGGTEIGQTVRLLIRRDGKPLPIDIATAAMPADLPGNMPTTAGNARVERLEAPEVAKPPLVVMPAGDAKTPLGVLVYFGPPPGAAGDKADAGAALAEPWKAAAAQHGVAVILPGSDDPQRWGRQDIAALARALQSLRSQRPIDPARVAFAGRGAGGAFAWLAADALGPAVRGVALLDSTLPRQAAIEQAEPGRSRWVMFGQSAAESLPKLATDRKLLEDNGFPVGNLPEMLGELPPAAALCGWVEALGVL